MHKESVKLVKKKITI